MGLGGPERGVEAGLVDGAVHQRGGRAGGGERREDLRREPLGRRASKPARAERCSGRATSAGRARRPSPAFGSCGRWACRSTMPGRSAQGRRSMADPPEARPSCAVHGPAAMIRPGHRRPSAGHRARSAAASGQRGEHPGPKDERRAFPGASVSATSPRYRTARGSRPAVWFPGRRPGLGVGGRRAILREPDEADAGRDPSVRRRRAQPPGPAGAGRGHLGAIRWPRVDERQPMGSPRPSSDGSASRSPTSARPSRGWIDRAPRARRRARPARPDRRSPPARDRPCRGAASPTGTGP